MSCVYHTNLAEFDGRDLRSFNICFSEFEIRKIAKMMHFEDRLRACAGRLLLLYILREQGGWREGFLPDLNYNSFERPFLQDFGFDFNISHSSEMVACSYISGGRTGMDIEQISPVDFGDYEMVFSETEMGVIKNSLLPIKEFYKFWTYKEAIMKANGTGFLLDPLQIAFQDDRAVVAGKEWFLSDLMLADGYIASVAFDCPGKPFERYVPWTKLASVYQNEMHTV